MVGKRIKSALISVYHKDGLDPVVKKLDELNVRIYSTGGTQRYIESLGIEVHAVEDLTGYPSILDGRVKTLHPKVFGGILARREPWHLSELEQYKIPEIDLVIVDLYPFEETLVETDDEKSIIEKIDIGGISLIRAAAKNYRDVVVIPSRKDYSILSNLLNFKNGATEISDRKALAAKAFSISAHYDLAIAGYFLEQHQPEGFEEGDLKNGKALRYGENPHQSGWFFGDLEEQFTKLNGKALSYNNLVDIEAAVNLMAEFQTASPTFAVLKHTNSCGLATRSSVEEAWQAALAGDPISAFGGILICNRPIDTATASAIDQIFYEVLIAPDFEPEALELLRKKKNRILLQIKSFEIASPTYRRLLNGVIQQDADLAIEQPGTWKVVTEKSPSVSEKTDLLFALKCVKHLKSNGIVLAKDQQLIGMGCGQTSRVDALNQAIAKAQRLGFDLQGAVMASDAFFPFPDCIEIGGAVGVTAVIQPGGSKKDQDSIDASNERGMAMVTTGVRHFKH